MVLDHERLRALGHKFLDIVPGISQSCRYFFTSKYKVIEVGVTLYNNIIEKNRIEKY